VYLFSDGQTNPNPGGKPLTADITGSATASVDDQSVRDALSEPGIVMVNCAGTNVAVQVISGAAPDGRREPDNGSENMDNGSIDGTNLDGSVDVEDASESEDDVEEDDQDTEGSEADVIADDDDGDVGHEEDDEVAPTSG
jgi:hypothetical protein